MNNLIEANKEDIQKGIVLLVLGNEKRTGPTKDKRHKGKVIFKNDRYFTIKGSKYPSSFMFSEMLSKEIKVFKAND